MAQECCLLKTGEDGVPSSRSPSAMVNKCLWGSVFYPTFLHLVPLFIFPPTLTPDLNPAFSGSVTEICQFFSFPFWFQNAPVLAGHPCLQSPVAPCDLPGSCCCDSWPLGYLGAVTSIPVDFFVPSACSLLLPGPYRSVVTIYFLLQ